MRSRPPDFLEECSSLPRSCLTSGGRSGRDDRQHLSWRRGLPERARLCLPKLHACQGSYRRPGQLTPGPAAERTSGTREARKGVPPPSLRKHQNPHWWIFVILRRSESNCRVCKGMCLGYTSCVYDGMSSDCNCSACNGVSSDCDCCVCNGASSGCACCACAGMTSNCDCLVCNGMGSSCASYACAGISSSRNRRVCKGISSDCNCRVSNGTGPDAPAAFAPAWAQTATAAFATA